MQIKTQQFFQLLLLCCLTVIPAVAFAQMGFVPCDGVNNAELGLRACSACDLASMGNTILNWLIGVMFVVFAVIMAVAGFGLVISGGNPSAKDAAKDKFVNAIIGLLIVLAAWVLVDTIMRGLLAGGTGDLAGFGPWSEVQCQVQPETTIVYQTFEKAEDVDTIDPTSPVTSTVTPVGADGVPVCEPSDPRYPDCGIDVVTNENMNPIFDPADGGSHMVHEGAAGHMAETLAGPFARLQQNFGGSVVINDAIAKEGTSRETNTPGSRHFHGDALDLSTAGMSDAEKIRLYNAAKDAGFTGFGFGNSILHVDRGAPRGWSYGNSTYGGQSVSSLIASTSN